jgi:hypothetical protein
MFNRSLLSPKMSLTFASRSASAIFRVRFDLAPTAPLLVATFLLTFACGRSHGGNDIDRGKGIALPASATQALSSSAGPVERLLHTKSTGCWACAKRVCSEAIQRCETIEGTALVGPSQNRQRSELCRASIECVLGQHCVTATASVNCYCGTANGVGCFSPGEANGPCKAALESGFETVDPVEIGKSFTDVKTGSGSAMNLVHCLIDHHCKACF